MMSHFFFDLISSTGLVPDNEGLELTDFPAAHAVAVAGARSIIQDDVSFGFIDLSGRIDVRDADRRLIASVGFDEAVELRGADPFRVAS